MTLEEHLVAGGFGSGVLEAYQADGAIPDLKLHGLPDQFVEHGPQLFQRHFFKLDAEGVAERALELFPDLVATPFAKKAAAGGAKDRFKESVHW